MSPTLSCPSEWADARGDPDELLPSELGLVAGESVFEPDDIGRRVERGRNPVRNGMTAGFIMSLEAAGHQQKPLATAQHGALPGSAQGLASQRGIVKLNAP